MNFYISGPMTGYTEHNYPAFHYCEAYLRQEFPKSYIYNPANNPKASRDAYFRMDLRALTDTDAVVLMPGWDRSVGATWEYMTAVLCGMKIFKFLPDEPGMFGDHDTLIEADYRNHTYEGLPTMDDKVLSETGGF